MATILASTFTIDTNLVAGQTETNMAIGYVGGPFRVQEATGVGLNNAVLTVSRVSADGATVTPVAVVTCGTISAGGQGLSQPGVLNASIANRTFAAGDTLRLVRSVANSTRLTLTCIGTTGVDVVES